MLPNINYWCKIWIESQFLIRKIPPSEVFFSTETIMFLRQQEKKTKQGFELLQIYA